MGKKQNRLGNLLVGLCVAGLASGCALEEVDGPGGGTDGKPVRIPSPEPGVDDRLDALGIICESTLIVTGSVTETEPQPAGQGGCWDVGTWKFTVAVDFQGCDPQPALTEEFVYEITRDEDSNTNIVYLADPDAERVNLKVTSAGDSLCHGGFEHFFEDGTVYTFHPNKAMDWTLSGDGLYTVWEEDPF
ncbi:MAG: hypothetical protein ACYTFT_14870 [Planctomycetota bacterium]|jgi:hypothetical protein